MNYVLLPKRMLEDLDVNEWREGGEISDNFLVEARLKLVGGWRSAGRMEAVMSELNNSVMKGHAIRACMENMMCGEVGR